MLVGLLLLVTLAMAAPWLQMNALAWLLEQVRSILLILLVILFQPELRRLLLALGQSQFLRWFYKVEPSRVIDEVVNGVVQVAEQGYGALIVLGRQSPLGSVVETVSPSTRKCQTTCSPLFLTRTPLHDQAVVIQGERLIAARVRCHWPRRWKISVWELGTAPRWG